MKKNAFIQILWMGLLAASIISANAQTKVWATGQILSAREHLPMANAVVAFFNNKNKVVDYAITDANGYYTVAIPKNDLHLMRLSGGGFLHQVFSSVGRFVGDITHNVAVPLKAAVNAVTSATESNITDPLSRAGIAAGGSVANRLIDTMSPPSKPKIKFLRKQPGVIVAKVIHRGEADSLTLEHVYWMQQEVYRVRGHTERAITAWLDPIYLSQQGMHPIIENPRYLFFQDATLTPSIATVGTQVTISLKLKLPPSPPVALVVAARNDRTGQIMPLQPAGGDQYTGRFTVTRKYPKNDQVISVLAYPEQPSGPGRDKKVEAAILKAGLWNPKRPFIYNPLLVASRNRADLTLTVVGKLPNF